MRIKQAGNKKDTVACNFISDEASVTIKAGGPVFLKPDGNQPGVSAVSAESLADARQEFFFGLAIADTSPNNFGEAINFGMFDYARIVIASRSATSATWASVAALAVGDQLKFLTLASIQALSKVTDAATGYAGVFAVLGTTFPSQTTQASSLGPAGLQYWTTTARVFLRALG